MSQILSNVLILHEQMNKKFDHVCCELDKFRGKYESDMLRVIQAYENKCEEI